MGYYKYAPWYNLINFISESPDEIANAVAASNDKFHHGVPMPSINDILPANNIRVVCERPCGSIDAHILAEIEPGKLSFKVGANAFSYVNNQIYFKNNIIGGMHAFSAGLPVLGQWYFSELVWKKIKDYDWEQHKQTVEDFLDKDDFLLELAEENGHFIRVKKLL